MEKTEVFDASSNLENEENELLNYNILGKFLFHSSYLLGRFESIFPGILFSLSSCLRPAFAILLLFTPCGGRRKLDFLTGAERVGEAERLRDLLGTEALGIDSSFEVILYLNIALHKLLMTPKMLLTGSWQ